MKRSHIAWLAVLGLLITSGATVSRAAQKPATKTAPVNILVSVEARDGKNVPAITKEDVRAYQGQDLLSVTNWVPLRGDQPDLDLLILIDETSRASIANQFDDIRHLVDAQPPTAKIAVGYLQNGMVRLTQNFTTDHAAAGKSLRIPLGLWAGWSSPYLAVTDAIHRWPASSARHVILLISNGMDPLQPGYVDSYLDQAIQTAQRTGTQVYTLYATRAGHYGHSFWRINQGQTNLSRLADETGGEAYFQGFSTPVAFAPFLNQFATRLTHQYRLTVLAKAGEKPSYQHIRLDTEVPNADLVSADRVYIPAAK